MGFFDIFKRDVFINRSNFEQKNYDILKVSVLKVIRENNGNPMVGYIAHNYFGNWKKEMTEMYKNNRQNLKLEMTDVEIEDKLLLVVKRVMSEVMK
jgi:hypothetical protein